MSLAICTICQCEFERDADWKDRCKPCFIKTLGTKKRTTYQEQETTRTVYIEIEKDIPTEMINRLIRLCHPDFHNNSQASNIATAWLLELRQNAKDVMQ